MRHIHIYICSLYQHPATRLLYCISEISNIRITSTYLQPTHTYHTSGRRIKLGIYIFSTSTPQHNYSTLLYSTPLYSTLLYSTVLYCIQSNQIGWTKQKERTMCIYCIIYHVSRVDSRVEDMATGKTFYDCDEDIQCIHN
jgi:hypothetical protein